MQATPITTPLHEVAVWGMFFAGVGSYWLKRGYYLITGPNPIAMSWRQFFARSWVPLLVRAFLESLVFWLAFTPGLGDKVLAALGWSEYEWGVVAVTHVPPLAAVFGHTIDSIVDMAVSKIPLLNQILPQMPGPVTKT